MGKGRGGKGRGSGLAALLAVLLFLAGAGVILYPVVSSRLAGMNQAGVIQNYEDKLSAENEEFYEAEWQKAHEYNESLTGDTVRDPFIPGSGYVLPENYLECLNIDGVMGYIEIPKIDVRLPIYHGTGEETLQKGVGHLESTSLPAGGEFTHSVLTGHRGLPAAELFTNLDQLEVGDRFYLHILDEVLAYEVDRIITVLPEDIAGELAAVRGRDLVTLVTCTPYGVNTHRLLVRGTRVPYDGAVDNDENGRNVGTVSIAGFEVRLLYVGAAIGAALVLIIVIAVVRVRRRRENRRRYEK